MNFFQKIEYPLTVFFTGAAVLILEISATKILSPYFGNTIFTVSGIITIVLIGLSVGYFFGGKLADKKPSPTWYYALICASGLGSLLIFFLKNSALPIMGKNLSLFSGPLISSFTLFFLPVCVLGFISPYAIKLQEQRLQAGKPIIGSVSGQIFFWSTFGSIFGSLVTSFILVPFLGLNSILLLVSTLLILVGSPLWFKVFSIKIKILGAISLLVLFTYSFILLLTFKLPNNVLFQKDGIYEKISVIKSKVDNRDVNFLIQDMSFSAAAFTENPDELVFDYTKYYSLYSLFLPKIDTALVIGGGGFSIPKALLKEQEEVLVDVAEIEPILLDVAKKYFGLSENPRLNIQIKDGRRMLKDSNKNYDLIFSDVYYSLYSVPAHFTTKEFFLLAKEKLSPNGIFIANLIGNLSDSKPSFIKSEIKTFQEVFPNSYVFATDSKSSEKNQNIIILGSNSNRRLHSNDKLNTSLLTNLQNKMVNLEKLNLKEHKIFTDDFSAADIYMASVFRSID